MPSGLRLPASPAGVVRLTPAEVWAVVIKGRAAEVAWVPPAWDVRSVPDGRVRFGVVMPGLLVGGVEQWLVTLLDWVDPARLVCVGVAQLEPRHLDVEMGRRVERHCPLGLGWAAVQALAERCDVLLVWSEADWRERVAGPESCRVVLVAHGESDWTRSVMAEAKHAAGLVAVSEAARRSFPEDQRGRVTVIQNGVDPERVARRVLRREVRQAWGVPDGCPLVGYLGRLAGEKDPGALVRALECLPRWWRGVVLGHGPLEEELRREAQTRTPGRVSFAGTARDVGSALGALDWLLLPSEHEGGPLVVLESWLAGVPVVATSVGVVREYPELVREIPVRASGAVIAAALQEDERDRKGTAERAARAQMLARNYFTAPRFGAEWTELLVRIGREACRPGS